jgi:hypothetical protein
MVGPAGNPHLNYDFQLSMAGSGPGQASAPAPIVPEELLVTFLRTGPPDKKLPFVIENIPLP